MGVKVLDRGRPVSPDVVLLTMSGLPFSVNQNRPFRRYVAHSAATIAQIYVPVKPLLLRSSGHDGVLPRCRSAAFPGRRNIRENESAESFGNGELIGRCCGLERPRSACKS
jgi:hypothetical protein